ncbi:hypothetical protein HY024_00640 [Candidatus Curtissbacteria bacterium]|nr:hypothetical protein [Candidatus Curtissbacteria bacterium]
MKQRIKRTLLSLAIYSSFVICQLSFVPSPAFAQLCPPEAPNCNNPATQTNPIGTVDTPGGSLPTVKNPNTFVANFIRTLILLILIIAFVIATIWMIIAGMQFIFAGGDPKNISTAWSRIYWGIIGLVVVLASFAIIKMVETFFNVQIISNGLTLPRI